MNANRQPPQDPRQPHRYAVVYVFVVYWLPVLLWMGVIFWFSSQPSLPKQADPLIDILTKKLAHAGEYSILALLLVRALGQGAIPPRRVLLFAWGVVILYAISDEVHQSFTPNRQPSPLDVVLDSAGGAIALLCAQRWGRNVLQKLKGGVGGDRA